MSEERQADAVLLPANEARRRHPLEMDRLEWYRREFGPVLGGARRVYSRFSGAGQTEVFLTAEGVAHRYHPDNHPLAGCDRYAWKDRGDGILYGTLLPEEPADA